MSARAIFAMMMCAVCALIAPTQQVLIVYNASDSAPRGWYWIERNTTINIGDYVLAELPHAVAAFADRRHYLPRNIPLLKHVAALAGQRVCIRDRVVTIDGQPLARALLCDSKQRVLPVWNQCRALNNDELFLFNAQRAASFDSRYFGPIHRSAVRGRAIPIWVRNTP